MAKTNWTQQQQEAINTRNKNIIVSAAAGSGKTAVLTQRIIELIVDEKIDVTSMLVLTFTNAAANEMKTRIQKKMYEYLEENPKDRHIRNQISLVPSAPISTMHSFCIESIRQNFNVLDIDPSFTIGNESTISMIKLDVIHEIFDEIFEYSEEEKNKNKNANKDGINITKDEFFELLDIYCEKNDDKKLIEIVYQIHSFIQGKIDPLAWLDEQVSNYKVEKIEYSEYYKSYISSLKNVIEKYELKFENAYNYSIGTVFQQTYESDLELIRMLKSALEKNYTTYLDNVSSIKFAKAATFGKKQQEAIANDIKKLKKTEDLKKLRTKILKPSFESEIKNYTLDMEECAKYMQKSAGIVDTLCRLVKKFAIRYSIVKKEQNIFDFNDLEHFMLDLLKNDSVKETLKSKYNYIFYDEYQDSNEVHNHIIEHIAREDNLFFVGDVKQSIYGFRLADPSLFIEKYESYSNDEISTKIDLSSNFRSNKQILDFCNKIFKAIMNKDTCDIDYDDDAMLKTTDTTPNKKDMIQINFLYDEIQENHKEIEDDDILNENESLEKIEMFVETTAHQINDIMEKDKSIQYKDIVILQRGLVGCVKSYEKIFKKYNIPVFVDYKNAVFQILEVSVFIDLLKLIDNYMQDEPLLSVMLSNIGGFSIEDIAEIKSINTKQKYFYKNVTLYCSDEYKKENPETIDDVLAEKISKFLNKISSYAEIERYMPLDEFIDYIMKKSNYKDYVMSMRNGKMRLGNLNIVIEKAREFMQSENKSLFNFLLYIDSILKNKNDSMEPKKISESQNMVRVMSIHKSKGLEFDTVILNINSDNFSKQDVKKEIYLHSKLGIGIYYTNVDASYKIKTLPRYSIESEINKSSVAEEIRIFYVALTRAKKRLIINLKDEKFKENIEKSKDGFCIKTTKDMTGYADFLLLGMKDDSDTDLYEYNEINVRDYIEKNDDEDTQKKFDEVVAKITISEEEKNNLDKKYLHDYKYAHDREKEVKMSVTSISKQKIKYNIPPMTSYDEYEKNSKISATQRGTLNHLFLEHIDFSRDYDMTLLEENLRELVELEFITEDEAKEINLVNVDRFLRSDLGERIKKSPKIYQEESFIMNYDGSILTGIVDLFFEEGDDIVLVDYKTDIATTEEEKIAKVDYYSKQIELYKDAIAKAFGKKVKQSYIYFLRDGESREVVNE